MIYYCIIIIREVLLMSDLEKILQLVQKNDGYITTKEVVDNGLNKMAKKTM